ncbi:hypothetical protein WJX84_006715 [Apatococcus fuscideae]|uniref:Uncharacterized protein n=1 Tax=Apatococcus fuscideae TaxID=2026836 RepID=A0AAW1T3B6_9CHLO
MSSSASATEAYLLARAQAGGALVRQYGSRSITSNEGLPKIKALLLVCPIFLNDEWIISAFFRLLLHLHQLVLGNFEIYQQVVACLAELVALGLMKMSSILRLFRAELYLPFSEDASEAVTCHLSMAVMAKATLTSVFNLPVRGKLPPIDSLALMRALSAAKEMYTFVEATGSSSQP